jgi:hypothetical protein
MDAHRLRRARRSSRACAVARSTSSAGPRSGACERDSDRALHRGSGRICAQPDGGTTTAAAVALASVPDEIRGYGHVKKKSLLDAATLREQRWQAFTDSLWTRAAGPTRHGSSHCRRSRRRTRLPRSGPLRSSNSRVRVAAAQQPPRPRTNCSPGIDHLCRLRRQHFGGATGRCGSTCTGRIRDQDARQPTLNPGRRAAVVRPLIEPASSSPSRASARTASAGCERRRSAVHRRQPQALVAHSALGLNRLLPIAYFDRLGVPRFS